MASSETTPDYPSWMHGWRRTLVGCWVYILGSLAACVAARAFGRTLLGVGSRLRPMLPPEFAHKAFLIGLRIAAWEPAWVEETRNG